jgi:hypothetical protein
MHRVVSARLQRTYESIDISTRTCRQWQGFGGRDIDAQATRRGGRCKTYGIVGIQQVTRDEELSQCIV